MTPDFNFEVQRGLALEKALIGGLVAVTFTWSFIEFLGDFLASLLANCRHALALGQVLAD